MTRSGDDMHWPLGFGNRRVFLLGLATLGLSIGFAVRAAQGPASLPVGGAGLGLHPSVFAAADALGMIRGAGQVQNATRLVVTSYEGTGTLAGAAFSYRYEYVFAPYRATRQQRSFQDGRTVIEVAREGRAWNEAAPGIKPTPVASGAERRMAEIYLTPHGALRAAIEATSADVKISSSGQFTLISLTTGIGSVQILLGADNRPVRSEVRVRGGTVAADFSGYKDFNNYGVFAPAKIVRRENGKVVGELVVTAFVENPYVIVPFPEQLIEAAQSQ